MQVGEALLTSSQFQKSPDNYLSATQASREALPALISILAHRITFLFTAYTCASRIVATGILLPQYPAVDRAQIIGNLYEQTRTGLPLGSSALTPGRAYTPCAWSLAEANISQGG